jgi:hypothetical protein
MPPLDLPKNFKHKEFLKNLIPTHVFAPNINSSQNLKIDVDRVIVNLVQAKIEL